jgi:hypothetical protein
MERTSPRIALFSSTVLRARQVLISRPRSNAANCVPSYVGARARNQDLTRAQDSG